MTVEEKPDITYNDVGGAKEQIAKLREVVEVPLLHPERFTSLGIDPPKVFFFFNLFNVLSLVSDNLSSFFFSGYLVVRSPRYRKKFVSLNFFVLKHSILTIPSPQLFLLVRLPTGQMLALFVLLDLSWFKNMLVRVLEWFVSCFKWPDPKRFVFWLFLFLLNETFFLFCFYLFFFWFLFPLFDLFIYSPYHFRLVLFSLMRSMPLVVPALMMEPVETTKSKEPCWS